MPSCTHCPARVLPPWQAKKAGEASAHGPQVKFNRLLLRFGTLHEGFAACRTVFRQLCGSEDAELGLEQLRLACTQVSWGGAGWGPVGCAGAACASRRRAGWAGPAARGASGCSPQRGVLAIATRA